MSLPEDQLLNKCICPMVIVGVGVGGDGGTGSRTDEAPKLTICEREDRKEEKTQ